MVCGVWLVVRGVKICEVVANLAIEFSVCGSAITMLSDAALFYCGIRSRR